MYSLLSPAFVSDGLKETGCYTTLTEWTKIHRDYPEAKRIFARCRVGDREAFCALGEPIADADNFLLGDAPPPLIVPYWFQTILSVEAAGEAAEIEWMTEESFPQATKIVLRPHDSAFYHSDAKEELEAALTQYGVLQKGTTIPVSLGELDGYSVLFDIIDIEPANVVLLEGEEVVIEFEEALDAAPTVVPAAVPVPVERPLTPFPDEIPFLNVPSEEPEIPGVPLGGVARPPLPDGRPWNPWR